MNVPRPLLRDNIYAALRADILACRVAPGEDMREQDLAAQYAVSRQPVRDALLRLEQENLVTVQARQGYKVNSISVADARDLFRFRAALEPACVTEAAEHASTETLKELDRFRDFNAGGDFIDYNRAFHSALAQACGNHRMASAACDLIEQADRLVRVSLSAIKGRDPAQLVAEHGVVIEALQRRDARRASRLIRDHIARAERRILSALSRSAVVI
jgi:GntR family transcriptional regulator, rspAB operon transcriptional repressor